MNIILIIIIAVSLSMDAFSLSLAYGTLNLPQRKILFLSSIVGIYHFFMPIIGRMLGKIIFHYIPIKPDIIVLIILSFIGINMIIETFKKEECEKIIDLKGMILFGFAVSLDALSVGVSLTNITTQYLLSSIIFSICSFLFTYIGLLLGSKTSKIIGSVSTIIGGFFLILIGVLYAL